MPTVLDQRPRLWQMLYLAGILAVASPYFVSYFSQLCSDDFILLYYYGQKSPLRLGVFFNPDTMWTWHPLQHLWFSIAWHISGIEPWAYRTLSIGLHLATAVLLMTFVRGLTGSLHLGGLSAIFFAGYWRHWEAVTWAAAIATLQSTFFTALTCVFFLRHLQTRRRAHYALSILAGVGWMLSKETVIQWPALLAAIYLWERWFAPAQRSEGAADESKAPSGAPPTASRPGFRPAEAAALLALPALLLLVYLPFRLFVVEDVYPIGQTGYINVKRSTLPSHGLKWIDRAMNPFLYEHPRNPLFSNPVGTALRLNKAMKWIARKHLVAFGVIGLVLYFALIRRRGFPLLALSFVLVTMVPYVGLKMAYAEPRYHYCVTLGGAMLTVALGWELWRLTLGRRGGLHSLLRMLLAMAGGLGVACSFLLLSYLTLTDRDSNDPSRAIYDYFVEQAETVDRPVLYVVEPHPPDNPVHVDIGWGLLECSRLAFGNDSVAAVELGFDLLSPEMVADLNQYAEKRLVVPEDLEKGIWTSVPLPPGRRLRIADNPAWGVELEE